MTKSTAIRYVQVQACLSEQNFPFYSILNTILEVKLPIQMKQRKASSVTLLPSDYLH